MVNSNLKIPSEFLKTKSKNMKMETKKILVSFFAIATVLFLLATVAASDELASGYSLKVNDMFVVDPPTSAVTVVAGEEIELRVTFTSAVNASDVKVKAELEGQKKDVEAISNPFDVESNGRYTKYLTLKVPSELDDELSDDLSLNVKIYNQDYKTESFEIELRVQRESYDAEVMSISTVQSADAGETLPVDVVLKNVGYNDLDDLYVTVSIPALGVERTGYFGDIVAIECDDDDEDDDEIIDTYGVLVDRKCNEDDSDTVSGRIYLEIPENAKSGIYTVEVEVSNDDMSESAFKELVIENEFSGANVIATMTGKAVAVGEDAVYSILIVNPTSKLKVYRIVPEASADLSVSVDESVIAIPAGSSKTVQITANAIAEGAYNFNVDVFAGEELINKVALSANVEGSTVTRNPIVVLTVVLAIIFVVLLIVLIVLLGKKPEKTEEFGESYY